MEDWNGNKIIKALYKYLNTNALQVANSNYDPNSGYFYSINTFSPDFEGFFSHSSNEEFNCPTLVTLLSGIYAEANTDKDRAKVTSHINLIKKRLLDGTTLFNDYSFLLDNDEITADNIEEKLNKLIEYAYRTKVTVFKPTKIKKLKAYQNVIELQELRDILFSEIISHNKTLLYGCVGSGKTSLIKYVTNFYEFRDVCYTIMDKSLPDTINSIFNKTSEASLYSSLSEIDQYNNAILIIDNYKYYQEDFDVLKKLMDSDLSVILVCNEFRTYKSIKTLNGANFSIHEMPNYSDESLRLMINNEYPITDEYVIKNIIEYSGQNPLMISFITSSLLQGTPYEKVFEVLESLNPKAKLQPFRSAYSSEIRDAGNKVLTGHIKSIYNHKINILKETQSNEKLIVLFAIACFGWNNIPLSFIIDIISFLDLPSNPGTLIKELIEYKYLQNNSEDYITISPILGDIIFSQYNDFCVEGLFFEKDIVSIYEALNKYLDSHHLHFKDFLLCFSIRVFICRTYRLIKPSDNSSQKTDRVKRTYDNVYSTCVKAFRFCCRNGALYDAEKILMSLRHLEDYRPNSSKKLYASNTYTIYDHKLLKLMETLCVDMVYGSVSPNNNIAKQIDDLTKDLIQNGANGINPKNISEFMQWRKNAFEELSVYVAIDKTILSIVSLPYNQNIDINKIFDFYDIAVVSVFKKIVFKVDGNDSDGYDYSFDSDVYTTIIFEYLNSFFNCSFKNIEMPKNYTKPEPLDDYIYRLSIWVSLKTISIITSEESLDIKLQLFESDLLPSLDILVSILKDRLTIIPIYLMISFIRAIQSLGIAISFFNMDTKKEEDIYFPVSEEDLGTICQKCYIDYKPFCTNIIHASSDINRYLVTSENTAQAE